MRTVRPGYAGYMTVYLALATGVLLSLLLTVLEVSRRDTIRLQTECAADMALDSVLAEYHREMLAQYDLFFIDTAYGTGDPSFHRTEAHILDYMQQNCNPARTFGIWTAKDITGLSAESAKLLYAGVATDDGGGVLKYHVVRYMKDIYGLSAAESLLSAGKSLEGSGYVGEGIEAAWDASQESLKEEIRNRKRLQDEEWDGSVPETPADAVHATRSEGILGTVAQGHALSGAAVTLEAMPSRRSCNQGSGLSAGKEVPNSLIDNGLLYAYILQKCGRFGAEKPGSALAYEVEYILQRHASDMENLKATARELLLIREAANAAFLFGSSLKIQAQEVALLFTALLGVPELEPAVTQVLLFAWAYAESVKDVRILFEGGKVPLVKQESNWNTPFSQLLTYRLHLDHWKDCQEGMDYGDYLGALLTLHGASHSVWGLMDMMECDIRRTPGNGSFRIDGLIDGVEAKISVCSRYGYQYTITRKYEYE